MAKKQPVVAVIGLGLIGGSICYALRKQNLVLYGVSSRRSISRALEMGIIDHGFEYDEMGKAVGKSDYVFICTPLTDIAQKIPVVFKYAPAGSIVTDAGSTKTVICSIAQNQTDSRGCFIGGHPMTGSEKRGIENANPYLFYDAVYVLTPSSATPRKAVKKLSSLISAMGARVMVISPRVHDRIAASVSHLPQLLAVLLTNHLADKNDDLFRNLAAGGFRDMTRIASSSYQIWKDIISTNTGEIKKSLLQYRDQLDRLVENLENDQYMKSAFETACRERKTIPRYGKGFLKPLVDVRVNVKDRPGEIARISNVIYYHGVNIKDIEIVNIREGEGGVLRIGFAEKPEAQKAARALKDVGYEVVVLD
ncbi:MAG: prephenate dehydrogenase/arogenate dehydrogenase family protein [Spirochaetota bacterium]